MPAMQDVAEKVMVVRRRKHMTQQALAEKAGLTRQQITMFETGKFPNIPAHALLRIAQALDMRPDELFGAENGTDVSR